MNNRLDQYLLRRSMLISMRWVFCALFCVSCFSICRADEAAGSNSAVDSGPSSQQLQGFNLNGYNNNGEKAWDVNGTKADITDQKIQITNTVDRIDDESQTIVSVFGMKNESIDSSIQ